MGDSAGLFYAIDAATGHVGWILDTTQVPDTNTGVPDQHAPSYGQIVSTAAYSAASGAPAVYVGAGGSVLSIDEHLGYEKHAPEGRDGGNSRNGTRCKTVL